MEKWSKVNIEKLTTPPRRVREESERGQVEARSSDGWKAQVRLCKRYRRLLGRGKHANVVITAIARELIAFMWAIAKKVPLEA